MNLVTAVILICAATVPRSDCQPETALHVVVRHEATSVGSCGIHAQALLATSAFADNLRERTYLKVNCVMGRHTVKTAAQPPE
jgi:hypothetical protein